MLSLRGLIVTKQFTNMKEFSFQVTLATTENTLLWDLSEHIH